MFKNKTPKQNGVSPVFMLIAIALTSIILVAATTPVEKKYKYEATLNDFIKGDKWMSIAKQALERSDLPSKDVTMIKDSLTAFQNSIVMQINAQLEADKKISDSTNKKPKN